MMAIKLLPLLCAGQVRLVGADFVYDLIKNADVLSWASTVSGGAVSSVEGCVTAVLSIIALIMAWVYRRRVIFFLTGDEFLHADWADSIYWALGRCCGCCDGEWTRIFSQCCCIESLRGTNLVKEFFRRCCGVLPKQVVLRGIVVGDLPVSSSIGSYYIQVECGENPIMVTDVVEDVCPEHVEFNQEFNVRMRDAKLAPSLHIVVKELNIFGSDVIASVKIPAQRMFKKFIPQDKGWFGRRNNSGFQRVRIMLTPESGDGDLHTNPWVSFEVGMHKDHDYRGKYMVHLTKTRGADWNTITTRDARLLDAEGGEAQSVGLLSGCAGGGGVVDGEDEIAISIKKFKQSKAFRLHDADGRVIAENPDEVESEQCERCVRRSLMGLITGVMMLALAVTITYRLYLLGCWTSYTTVAKVDAWMDDVGPNETNGFSWENATFPLPSHAIKSSKRYHVSDDDILEMCHDPPTKHQPVAFNQFSHQFLGGNGVSCHQWGNACELRQQFMRWRWVVWSCATIIFCAICYCNNKSDYSFDQEPDVESFQRTSRDPGATTSQS
mmetsp:Transcript_18678/g.33746  ORF Transcript_18678/g.33746 Transcript_18678/m.33746 type:complete len:552 (-) Transcript_18678:100-1755(-)